MKPNSPFFISEDGGNLKVFINTKDINYCKIISGIIQYNIFFDNGVVN